MEDTEHALAASDGIDPVAAVEDRAGTAGSAEVLVARFHALAGNVRAHVPAAMNGDVRACGAAVSALLDLVEALLGTTKPAG